ncbi:MAG: hypothetical protein ACXVP0_05930 [Bacteroidia bacterium]
MKKLGFCALLLLLKTHGWSQTTPERRFTKEELLAREQAHQTKSGTSMTAVVLKSDYFGFDTRIKTISKNGLIPEGFPKAAPDMTREKYAEEANAWVSKNPTYIKPEYQNYNFNDNK